MPTKKNNIPTRGFIRKQDNVRTAAIIPTSGIKPVNIRDLYGDDKNTFSTRVRSYENQGRPSINTYSQRIVDEAYYPEDYAVVDRASAKKVEYDYEDRQPFHPFFGRIEVTGNPIRVSPGPTALSAINPDIASYYGNKPFYIIPVSSTPNYDQFAAIDAGVRPPFMTGDAYTSYMSRTGQSRADIEESDYMGPGPYDLLNTYLFPGASPEFNRYIISKDDKLDFSDVFTPANNPAVLEAQKLVDEAKAAGYEPYNNNLQYTNIPFPTEYIVETTPVPGIAQTGSLQNIIDDKLYDKISYIDGAPYYHVRNFQPIIASVPESIDRTGQPKVRVKDFDFDVYSRYEDPQSIENRERYYPEAVDYESSIQSMGKGKKSPPYFYPFYDYDLGPGINISSDLSKVSNLGVDPNVSFVYRPEYKRYDVETTQASPKPIDANKVPSDPSRLSEIERGASERDELINNTFLTNYLMNYGYDESGTPKGNRRIVYYEDDKGDITYAIPGSRWGTQGNQAGAAQEYLRNFDEFTTKDGKLRKPKVIEESSNPKKFQEMFDRLLQFGVENAIEGNTGEFQGQSDPGGGIIRKDLMSTQKNTIDMKEEGGFTRKQDVPAIGNLKSMPTDYMSGFNPNAMTQSGQTNNPRLFRGNATGFPLRAGTEGANPELYITAGDVKFSPQSLYRTGQAIMPSFGVRGDVAYDRSLTPEVREDIFRYTGRNISPFNTRFNPYIEVSGPRGNTVTGGVSFGGQVTPGGQSGLSYNVGYRKTFAEGGYSRHQPGNYFVADPDGTAQVNTGRGLYADRVLQDDAIGLGEYAAPNPGGGGFAGEVTKNLTQPEIIRGGIVKEEVQKKIDSDNRRQREIDRGTLPAYSFNKKYGKDTETLNGYAPGTPGHTFAMYGQDIKLYSYGDNTAEENRQLVDELEQIFRENGLAYSEELNQSLQAFRDKTYHNYLVKNKDVLDGYYAQVKDYDNLLAAQSAPGVDNTRMEARMLDAFRPEFPLEAQRNPVVIKKSPLSAVHNTLAVAGMVPVIGEPLDLLDAALYTLEGDYGGAALAGASVVPFMGSGAGALRLTGAAKTLAKGAEEGSDLNRYIKQIERERRMYANPGASQEGFDYLRYSEQFPQLSKESEYLSNLGFYNINRKTGAQAVDDYTSAHHLSMNTAFDNLKLPNQKRPSSVALNELVLDNSKRMANDLDDFISSGIGGRTSRPITLSRASTDEVVRVVNADNSITVKKFSELQPNDVILETKFTSYYDPNRPLFNQNMFNKTADDYGLGYFPVRQQTYIPQGTKLGVPTFHGNAKMFQDEAEFIGNRFGVRRFTGMNPDGSYGFQLIGGFQDGGSVSGEEPVSDNTMDNVEESIDYSQYNTDIVIMASKFSMSPDEYIEYYNKGIQMLNAGNTIDDLVNMGYGNKEALLSMFPGASVESRGKSQTLQQEIKHIPVTNLLADTDSRTDVSKVGADMIEFVDNGQTSESATLKMQSGGIFENPITSAMERMDEFGNMIVNQNLKNALGETVEDTFGFNFLPDDSNCEVEVIYKAQEGGYSMNQDNVVEQLVEGIQDGAGKIYDFISGMGDRAEDIIEISKNPNYVNQNQPFLNKALDAFKLYLSGQPAAGEGTPAPVKTEQGENTDSPVALTPAKINANNITAAIEQVAKDDENLATLLGMTAYMENSYGANPNAYGREYTHSFMSLDDPSLNQIFDIRTGATDYTKGQKAIFNMFESLGLPSDKESFIELLDKDDPLASVAAARAYYATVPEALPASSDTEGLFNYFSKYYNRGGQGKYQTEEESLNRFLEGYTRLVEQEDFANGGTVGETGKILVSSNGVFDRNYEPGKPVIVPTRNGVITMDGVDEDLLAISNKGEFRFMDADSGNYQFEGKTILEVPVKMFYGKDGGLADWFKEEWVRIDTEGNITGPCGTMKKGKATTRCLPKKKAQSLTKAERKATARKKVRGSKKGKQFVANTKKAKVTRKDTKRYEEGGQTPLSESFVMVDVSKMDTPRENKSFTFADNLSQYSTATAASKALNANDIRDFLKSEGYDVSLTDGKTLSSDELSALNAYMTGQQSVMLDGGELPYQTFIRVTGLPWPEAKRRGFTDGSYEKNIALQNMLLEGKTLGTTMKPDNRRSFAEEEGLVEINIR